MEILGGYLKRISFLNGQVLHDFHLNIMQRNIAEAIKQRVTQERYDILLMTSNYEYYFCEPLIDETNRDASSTANLNNLTFTIHEGDWVTPILELPERTDEVYIYSNFEDFPSNGAVVKFYYRVAATDTWRPINVDTATPIAGGTKYIQLKAELAFVGTTRPTLYDFAIFTRKSRS